MTTREWLRLVGSGALIPAEVVLAKLEQDPDQVEPVAAMLTEPEPTWRERLWTAPAETRIGVAEVCEAFGRPKSWLYRHTSGHTIPHRKLDGELCFSCGELRAWAREHEVVVKAGPMDLGPGDGRGLRVMRGAA